MNISNRGDLFQRLRSKREKIDLLDQKLLVLLNQRVRMTLEIGRIKEQTGKPIYDSQREKEVRKKLEIANQGPLKAADLRRIFAVIMRVCRGYQQRSHP